MFDKYLLRVYFGLDIAFVSGSNKINFVFKNF